MANQNPVETPDFHDEMEIRNESMKILTSAHERGDREQMQSATHKMRQS